MTSTKKMILVYDGAIYTSNVHSGAPRPFRKWMKAYARRAILLRAAHFAIRREGVWQVYHCYGTHGEPRTTGPLRSFDNEDAAAMWLIHKEMR